MAGEAFAAALRQGGRAPDYGLMTNLDLDDATLDRLMRLSESADPPPWRSSIEDRDHTAGDSFIMIGPDNDRREDMYVSRDSGPASPSTLDLLADAVPTSRP
jgi:hypothetical protein